jgi:alanine-glyoxylate transaminase / serine-glyoxylate transaminase / serine-pyruvate transaminase
LRVCGIPHRSGGIDAAIDYLSGNAGPVAQAAE